MTNKVVTPSADIITAGQIGKICDLVSSRLRKSGLASEPTQMALETQGKELTDDVVAAIRKRVEAVSNMIVRHVSVNRNLTPQEVLDATGRKQYTDKSVVEAMPKGEGKKVEVIFFKPRPGAYQNGWLSDEALDKEFDFFCLKPADPYSQAAVNEDDSAFADERPNGTHWKDAQGHWCFAAFDRWRDGRYVDVDRRDVDWHAHWWFAGLRK